MFYHVPGTPQSVDRALFRTPDHTTDLVVELALSSGGRQLFISEGTGAHGNGIGWVLTRLHVLDLGHPQRPSLNGALQSITSERDAAYQVVASAGTTLYVLTDRDAPRRRLVAIDLRNPAPAQWRDVIPQPSQPSEVLASVHEIGGRFVAVSMHNVQHGVRVFDLAGRLIRELAIPPMTNVMRVSAGVRPNELVVESVGYVSPPTRTRYDIVTGAPLDARPVALPFATADYEIKQVWYRAKDGVRVPTLPAQPVSSSAPPRTGPPMRHVGPCRGDADEGARRSFGCGGFCGDTQPYSVLISSTVVGL